MLASNLSFCKEIIGYPKTTLSCYIKSGNDIIRKRLFMITDKTIRKNKFQVGNLQLSRRWAIFLVTASLFVLSQFYRVTIAVITPELNAELSMTAQELSLMSAAFFYAFAAMQIPIAIYLDRIGAKKTMITLNLIAVSGALLFAAADSPWMLIWARALLGIGMACNLMGTFKLISLWFTPIQFATLTTIVFSLGTAGNILATTPLVLMVQSIGWRLSFVCVAGINLILTIAFYLTVRDTPETVTALNHTTPVAPSLGKALRGIRQLFTKKDYWIISFSTFCRYGIYAAIQALYAGPFLLNVMSLSAVETGNVLFCMNMGFICTGPLLGALSDRILKTRKWIIIPGLCGMAAIISVLALLPTGTSILMLAGLFFALGIFNSSGGIMYTHIKEKMPLDKSGMAMTGVNFFTMIGPAVFLQGLGFIMQSAFPANALSAAAFHATFLLCGLCLAVVAALYLFTGDKAR